ncbi:MAG: HD domain-containing protein [Candidatus Obscuribacter sp.]|nr:HD domain-containing protein [Candidatus Obscuribacter sp.]
MTQNTQTISLEEMVAATLAMTQDPKLLDLYDQGDKVSSSQTKHDVAHAYSVLNTANYLKREVISRFPELLSREASEVIIPAGAFLHDIGRAVSVNDHAGAGKKIALEYCREKNFPNKTAARIAAVVACHRSDDFPRFPSQRSRTSPNWPSSSSPTSASETKTVSAPDAP